MRLAGAIALATCLLSSAGAHAGVRTTPIVNHAKALADGTFKVGPKHTWHAVKTKPLRYGAMLLAIGLAGGGAKLAGIDPEPWAIGLSTATWGWSTWKTLPEVRLKRGLERTRSIGANLLWPLSLVVGTTIAGKLVGHGHATGPATLVDAAKAGGQSVVIGVDVPTIAQTVLDVPKKR